MGAYLLAGEKIWRFIKKKRKYRGEYVEKMEIFTVLLEKIWFLNKKGVGEKISCFWQIYIPGYPIGEYGFSHLGEVFEETSTTIVTTGTDLSPKKAARKPRKPKAKAGVYNVSYLISNIDIILCLVRLHLTLASERQAKTQRLPAIISITPHYRNSIGGGE